MKLKPIDCNNSQSFISPKRRDTDGSRNVQILTLFKIKILSCNRYSIEFFSSQSHHSLLCSFLRVRDCFIYFSALSSAPCSFFAQRLKRQAAFSSLVCYTAVFRARNTPVGGALRDDTKNGCVAVYLHPCMPSVVTLELLH